MKRIFIYSDEKSNKFWTIEVNGNSYTVNYGKVGTAGQTQTKDFADDAACQKAVDKLIAEKTKKGYAEQAEGAELAKPKAKDTKSDLKIPKYKEYDEASAEDNEFVINIKKPISILSVFKYQMKNFDEFIYTLESMPKEMALTYGVIDDEEYIPLVEYCEDDDLGDYDEEIIANILSDKTEYFPFIEQYAKNVVLKACEREKMSGPWTSENTLFGEFIIPMLAEADAKYFYLLEDFVNTNVELRYDDELQQQFIDKYETIAEKWGIKAEKLPDFSIYNLPEENIINFEIPEYTPPKEAEINEFVADISNPLSIASVIQYHIDNFDEYAKNTAQSVRYDTINDGKFQRLDYNKINPNGSEYPFFVAAASFPELHPLIANYMLEVIELSKKQTTNGPWSNTEFLLGGFAIEALVHVNPSYAPLLVQYMRSHIEIRCEPNYREQFINLL